MVYWQSNKIRPFSPNKVFLYFPPLPCLISILLICCLTLSTFAPDVSREAKGRRTSMKVPFTTVSLPTRGSLSMMLTTPARSWAVAHSPRSRVYSCTFSRRARRWREGTRHRSDFQCPRFLRDGWRPRQTDRRKILNGGSACRGYHVRTAEYLYLYFRFVVHIYIFSLHSI